MRDTGPVIGIAAPSSQVPPPEFALGLERIRRAGFALKVHSHWKQSHRFFAGTDEQRAEAFLELARDPRVPVIWCARGGYGANRLLPYLAKIRRGQVPRGKLLVGYSDATTLLEFTRTRWGWSSLHAAMPGLREFCLLKPAEWRSTLELIRGNRAELPWDRRKLRFWGTAPARSIEGEMVGGNLSVWESLLGTPYISSVRGKLLFLEDIGEPLRKIDKMLQHLWLAGALDGVRALVLGNFSDCTDAVPLALKRRPEPEDEARMIRSPRPEELAPLRKKLSPRKGILEIFGEVAARLKVPVAYELPVGHGPGHYPLPLGARYRLSRQGRLELLRWEWTEGWN